MSGHSKWANIKHRKEKTDAQKGKLFSKIGREISVVVRQGGPDPESNAKLRDVISKAKAANMPIENIMRCIKKASGEIDGENYEEIVYEGYGPGGVAIIVEAMTDNRKRTAGEIRHLFDKYGGNLGASGCVEWMFEKKGLIIIDKSNVSEEDELILRGLEAGAEDIKSEDDYYEITTEPENFSSVRESLEKQGYFPESAVFVRIPNSMITLEGKVVEKLEKLIELLEENEDVQHVYTNFA